MKFLTLIILLLSVSNVLANPFEIKQQAEELNTKDYELTYHVIDVWVEQNIKYQFYWFPRDIDITWKEKKGDCTDKAILINRMLSNLNIESRLVHGEALFNKTNWILHDWIEVRIVRKTYQLIDENRIIWNSNNLKWLENKQSQVGGYILEPVDKWITLENKYYSEIKKQGEGVW